MMFWSLFSALLIFALTSTCNGLEDVHCGDSNYVLESDPITLYGVAGSRILVLPRKVNGTRLEWKVQTGYKAFVKRVYRRLWIVNATQFAGASVWYDLTRNGTTVYTSAKGTVQVGSAPVLSMSISNIITVDHEENRSICFQYSGIPRPVVTLYKVVFNVPTSITSHPTFQISNSCLEIQSARHKDRGKYILEAKNCFETVTKEFRLKVLEGPRVTIEFQRAIGNLRYTAEQSLVSMKAAGHLILPYTVTGFPTPTVSWSHGNSMLDSSKYNASHLTLRNVEPSDAGKYVILVQNVHGRTTTSFLLSVRAPEPPPVDAWTSGETLVSTSREDTPSATGTSAKPSQTRTGTQLSINEIILTEDTVTSSASPSVNGVHKGYLGCDKSGDNPDDPCDDSRESSDLPPWMLASIVAGGVALAVVIAVVVFCYSKGFCCKQSDSDSEKGDSLQRVLKPDEPLKSDAIQLQTRSPLKVRFEVVNFEGKEDTYDHIQEHLYCTMSEVGVVGENNTTSDTGALD